MEHNSVLKTHPAVFAVGNDYQIMVPVRQRCIMWAQVAGVRYYDSSNGINRSETPVHRMIVPMKELDRAGRYTLGYRSIIDRKPYFPELDDEVCIEYGFKPLGGEKLNIYHISDTHNMIDAPCKAGKYYDTVGEKLDLLVLNGDIPDHSGNVENFDTVYEIVSVLTRGGIPTIFSRGNHDLRGLCAESFAEYTPSDRGRSYYTIRLGELWALLLDCGEDKDDSHAEYGGTIDCHRFRLAQTEYLNEIIDNKKREYASDDVRYRLVISHVPFSYKPCEPFDIEGETYTRWCDLLKSEIKPTLMLSGHLHDTFVALPGDRKYDSYGQPCPLVVGSDLTRYDSAKGTKDSFTGCAITLEGHRATVVFNDSEGNIVGREMLEL